MRLEELFVTLLNMSITAGYVVVIVALLRLLLRKAPRWISRALWALVGLRLVLPFSFESIVSLIPSSKTVTPDILYSSAPSIHSGVPTLNSAVNPVIAGTLAPATGAAVSPMQAVMQIASFIWIAGIAVLALYSLVSYVRLRRQVASAVLLQDGVFGSDAVASPFVLGIVRPRIYLPFGVADGDRDYVLAHEQAHIRRKDHWIKPLGFLLLTVYWFNPLIWVAYILLCRDIELACDEAVIKDIGDGEKKAYSTALVDCAVSRRSIALCPLAFGEVGLKERVKNVLNYKKPAFWVIVVAVAASIVAAVCLLTNPKTTGATADKSYAEKLFKYRTSYIGDNSAVGNIVSLVNFPTDVAYDHIELQTRSKPYSADVYFRVTPDTKAHYTMSATDNVKPFRINACIIMSLIKNADTINFRLDDGTGAPGALSFQREWAESIVGADLWSESSSPARLDSLITRIKEHVESAYASAAVSLNYEPDLPVGTFAPGTMVYLNPFFNVTPDGFLQNNQERVFTVVKGSFGDGGDEKGTRYQVLNVGNAIQTFDTSGTFDIDVSAYHDKAGWSVLTADGQDTGYRIYRLDGLIWIGHWHLSGSKNDSWLCEYIFSVDKAKPSNAGGSSNTVQGKDVSLDVDVGAAATSSRFPSATSLPRGYNAEVSGDGTLYGYDFGSKAAEGYIGWIKDPVGWLVLTGEPGLSSQDAYVYLTHDGGKTWTELGNANAQHRVEVTGAGFASEKIGFISYRYTSDAGPDIWRTTDGGKSWSRLAITLPKEYQADNFRFTPLSPRFNGSEGTYRILFIDQPSGSFGQKLISMVSHDGGLSWSFENSSTSGATVLAPSSSLEIRPSGDGTDDFLNLLGSQKPSGYDNDVCFNITPDFVKTNSAYRIFKFSQSCASYLLYDGAVYPLGEYFGGSGVDSFALADFNHEGRYNLYFTFSWGSGLHRSQAGRFDPVTKKVTVFEASILNSDAILLKGAQNTLQVSTAKIKHVTDGGFVAFDVTAETVKGVIQSKDGAVQYADK